MINNKKNIEKSKTETARLENKKFNKKNNKLKEEIDEKTKVNTLL